MSFTNLAARICLWVLLTGYAFGDGVTVRELFVPESELPNLIDAVQQRVVLPRAEFEKLLRDAAEKTERITAPPVEAIIQANSYAITIADERAVIDATLTIECLSKTAVPLDCAGVSLLSAILEQESESVVAPLGFRDANTVLLILSQPGMYTLTCRFTTPLTIDATQQRLAFTLPRGVATACSLRVPGDVELASGAAILNRKVIEGVTHFDLLLPPERATQLLLSLNSHRVGTYHALFARGVQFAEVTEQYQRLHATISISERHQGIGSLEIAIPDGFDVTDVGATFLDSWNIAESVLTLTFRERVSGVTTISLTAVNTGAIEGGSWLFPLFQPRGVVMHSAVLGLLVDQDIDRLAVSSHGLIAIDTLPLRAAVPVSEPTLRLLSAHYAPEVSSAELTTTFRRPEVVLDAAVNQTLTLTDGQPLLTAQATVAPQTGRVFGTTISLPNTWRVTRAINASDNTELKFHTKENSNETRIDFSHGVRSHETFSFLITAVPRDDSSLQQTPKIDFPCLSVVGVRNQTGQLIVQDRSEEDWEMTATHTNTITAADSKITEHTTNNLVFDYTAVPLSLSLELAKRTGRATAKTTAFYRFTPTLVRVRCEVAFQITGATTRSLSCLLPSETPETVSIVGLDGLTIKETFSEQVDNKWRRWRAELPRPMTGTLRLAIDFDMPLSLTDNTDNSAKDYTLLNVIAEGVAWQSHLVAIEGDEELDISINSVSINSDADTLRPVDTGLTAGATYTPGQRLLGVFATRSDLPATVTLRLNALTNLPEAMIRRTTVTARIAEKLGVMYEAHYDLQFAGGSVVFTFPSTIDNNEIEFWGSDLDGTAIRPQRVGDDIVISIPRGAANVSRALRLFWWSPQQHNTQQHNTLSIPQMCTASQRVIPSLETVWQVIAPRGKRVITIGGERVTSSNVNVSSTITTSDAWDADADINVDRKDDATKKVPSRSRLTSAQPVSFTRSNYDADNQQTARFAVVGSRFAETVDVQLADTRAASRWSIVAGCVVLLLGLTVLTLPRRIRVVSLFLIITIAVITSLIADDTANNSPPLIIPDDAILVPYSLDSIPEGALPDAALLTRPDQPLWVPYSKYIKYVEMLEKKSVPAPTPIPAQIVAPYSLDAASYTVTTPQPTDTSLTLRGEMVLHVWVPEPVFIPLPLAGGALETPLLDGKPALCQSLSETLSLLRVDGIGEHRLTFAARFRIDRQGGWRLVAGTLPTAAATKVSFITPPLTQQNNTLDILGQRKWKLIPGETIETSLSGSAFQWQWRLGIQSDVVDRSLEVESLIDVTLQEDGCWIDWTPTLKIGRGTWEAIRCAIPDDYTIVEIVGENVRGWEQIKSDIIDVEMLKPAEKNESFTVKLFKQFVDSSWTLPAISLPDAGLHRGQINIRRSAVLQLRAADVKGLSPTDPAENIPTTDNVSPLGIVPFQSYRFHGETKTLTLEAVPIVATQYVSVMSRLNIAQHLTPKLSTVATVETTITFPPNPRPFEAMVTLPRSFSLRQLRGDDGVVVVAREQVIDILQANSTTVPVSVILSGDFHATAADNPNRITSLPDFIITTNDARPTQVDNALFVLTDPGLDANIERLSPDRKLPNNSLAPHFVSRLLPAERDWLRQVVEWKYQTPGTPVAISGEVVLSRRAPQIYCDTITNIRATNDALEETILLDFTIHRAGVREVAFILPGSLRDATIDAPLLRRIKRTQIDTVDAESVLVELELQDAVMNQFRVLIRSDRRLDIGTAYRITTPTVRDAIVTEQYVVLENDRRSLDEMTVTDQTRLQRLSRQQNPWTYLASMLGNNVTEAYCLKRDAESGDAANATPMLTVQMRRRETVRLAEARIDLAETRMVCGDNGAYCAEQVYRIDNKKEPYLDLRLPQDATLWGASLFSAAAWANDDRGASIPVKPCQMPESVASQYGDDSTQLVRIPLVKTESGDLDYVVRLVYAGTLPPISREMLISKSIDLPFISVLNIPVGASMVRLSLPKAYHYQFGGNLQRIGSDQQQQAAKKIVADYMLQQNARLDQAAQSGNSFAKSRAYSNQQQLAVMNSGTINSDGINISGSISGIVEDNTDSLSEANSSQLASQFYSQSNRRANDEVLRGRSDSEVAGRAIDSRTVQQQQLEEKEEQPLTKTGSESLDLADNTRADSSFSGATGGSWGMGSGGISSGIRGSGNLERSSKMISNAEMGVELGRQRDLLFTNAPVPAPPPQQVPTDKLSKLETRTASLDIAIPNFADHELYLFTTPQGSLELSLRATHRNAVARIASVLFSLIVLATCYGIYINTRNYLWRKS